MKDKTTIDNHLDKVLNSVEGIQRATPTPFFYTRLMAKLERNDQSSWQRISSFVGRPVIAFATILLVICINIFAIYSNSDSTINTTEVNTIDKTDIASVDEYTQVTSTIYDIENSKP